MNKEKIHVTALTETFDFYSLLRDKGDACSAAPYFESGDLSTAVVGHCSVLSSTESDSL